jgi:multidrug efflux system membrane fusion protein
MNKKYTIGIPIVILAAGMAIAVFMIRSRPKVERREVTFPPPLVRALEVKKADVRLVVLSQGTVSPRTESDLVSQVAGQVIQVSPQFAAGGFFRKGDILIQIDPRDYEFALARLRAEKAQAELRLAQEEGEAKIAREEWERLGEGERPNPLVLREPQLFQARAALEAAQAALKQAELNLERTRIRAPFEGRVRTKNVDLGEYVSPGIPMARIYAVDYAEVRLPIPDAEMAYLGDFVDYWNQTAGPLDLDVILRAEYAQEDYSWDGTIVRIEGEIDPLTRMVTLVARVKDPYSRIQENQRPPLAVGMFVRAEILGMLAEDVVVIPRSAVRGEDQLLVIDAQNRLHFRLVSVLKRDAENVLVDSGLDEGERICLSPMEAAVEGMEVRISEPSGNEDLPSSQGE